MAKISNYSKTPNNQTAKTIVDNYQFFGFENMEDFQNILKKYSPTEPRSIVLSNIRPEFGIITQLYLPYLEKYQ